MTKQAAPVRAQRRDIPTQPHADRSESLAFSLLRAMRPRQWIKNLLLFAGVVFTDTLPGLDWLQHPDPAKVTKLLAAFAAFAIFCMLSSGVYLMNDVRDANRDRQHPRKSRRPIAAGLVSVPLAIGSASALWIAALGLGGYLHFFQGFFTWKFGVLALFYLAAQFAYSAKLKDVPILDVCMIASGFVIRAMAGAAAIDTYISTWLIVCTGMLSLLIGFGKRRHEIILLGEDRADHRESLDSYSLNLIDHLVTASATGAIVMYSIYTMSSYTGRMHQRLYWTIPPVVYGVFRYIYMLHTGTKGGAPERDLLEDKHILAALLVWMAITILALKLPNFSFK